MKESIQRDKKLLRLEILVCVLVTVFLLSCVFIASFAPMDDWMRVVLIVAGFIPFVIGVAFAVRIEQVAGFYECQHCHHRYVPTYSQVLFSMQAGRTRRMKCPKCGEKSWSKKVLER